MTHYREQLEAGVFDPPSEGAEPEPEGGDGLDGLTVDDLKARAAGLGLPVSGTKAELLQRLRGEG